MFRWHLKFGQWLIFLVSEDQKQRSHASYGIINDLNLNRCSLFFVLTICTQWGGIHLLDDKSLQNPCFTFFVICTALYCTQLFSGNNLWTGNRIEIVFNFSLLTETTLLMDVRIRSLFRNCVLLPSHFLNMVGVWKPSFHYTILTMSFKTVQVHWSILK